MRGPDPDPGARSLCTWSDAPRMVSASCLLRCRGRSARARGRCSRSDPVYGGFEDSCGEPAIVLPDDLARGRGEQEPWLVLDAVSVGQPSGGVESDRGAEWSAEMRKESADRAGGLLCGSLVDSDERRQSPGPCGFRVPGPGR